MKESEVNDFTKNLLLWAVLIVVLLAVFSNFSGHSAANPEVPYG